MTAARLSVAAAYVLAVVVARDRPRHRPIAWALFVMLMTSCTRSALPDGGNWRRLSMALLLAPTVAGAWAATTTLRACPRPGTAALCAWAGLAAVVGFSGRPAAWWGSLLPAVHLLGVGAQAAAFARWAIREDRSATVTERTLLALLAGDVAAAVAPIVGGGSWGLARVASGAATLAACIIQGAEIRRAMAKFGEETGRCAKHGTALVMGWQGLECETCERDFMVSRGCKCGGTNLCADCQAAGATEATRGTIRCEPACSSLCPVCCPDD